MPYWASWRSAVMANSLVASLLAMDRWSSPSSSKGLPLSRCFQSLGKTALPQTLERAKKELIEAFLPLVNGGYLDDGQAPLSEGPS